MSSHPPSTLLSPSGSRRSMHSLHDHAITHVSINSTSATAIIPELEQRWTHALAKPSSLRTTEDLQLLKEFCRTHDPPLFPTVPDALLFDLCAYLTMTSFRRGQTLYRESEEVAFVFIILSPGTVALTQLVTTTNIQVPMQGEIPSAMLQRAATTTSPKLPPRSSTPNKNKMRSSMMPGTGMPSPGAIHAAKQSTQGSARKTLNGPLSPKTIDQMSHPSPHNLPQNRFITSVGGGGMVGARFSSSVIGFLVQPEETPGNLEQGILPAVIAGHTATARRSLHCICLPLHIFVRFFPDSDSIDAQGVPKYSYAHLPTSPKMNPFSVSPHLSKDRTTGLSPTRTGQNGQQHSSPHSANHVKALSNSSASSSSALTPASGSHRAGSAQLGHSFSELSLPPAHPGPASSSNASHSRALAASFSTGEFDPSVPSNLSRKSTPSHSRVGSAQVSARDGGATSPVVSSAASEETKEEASDDQGRMGRYRPTQLRLLQSSQSEPVIPVMPVSANSVSGAEPTPAAVAVAQSIPSVSPVHSSPEHSPPLTRSHGGGSRFELLNPLTKEDIAASFATQAGYEELDGHGRKSAGNKSLQKQGQKMWHVLTDAVALQSHVNKVSRASAAAAARREGGFSPKSANGSSSGVGGKHRVGSPSWDAELATLDVNAEDLSEISQEESEEAKLKRRLRFFRNISLGGIAKWNHEKLINFCMRIVDRRYSGRAMIYRQFDPSNHVYFIHTGSVQLQRSISEGGSSTSAGGHYLDFYTDHIQDEKLVHRTHAKSTLDVTTGTGALRQVSFEAVATHKPNPGQEDIKHAIATSNVRANKSNKSSSSSSSSATKGNGYTLLREFDYVSGKVARNSTQYFALYFQHSSSGYALRFNLQAHRGAAEIYVCTTALLPSNAKFTWMGSTHLSAKENAFYNSSAQATLAAAQGGGGGGSSLGGGGGNRGSMTNSSVLSGIQPLLSKIDESGTEEKSSPQSNLTGDTEHSISSTTTQPAAAPTRHHSCEVLLSPTHPSFRQGWFYISVCTPKGGGSCDFTLRVSTIPAEGNAWRSGSSSKAPIVSGLASLARGSIFGLDGVLNSAGRDEEALSLGDTLLYAITKEDFLSFFPPLAGNMNPALAEMIRTVTNLRLHRAELHSDILRLVKKVKPSGSSGNTANGGSNKKLETVDLSLEHYSKLEAQRNLLTTALQRYSDRQIAKAKIKSLEAAQEASGIIPKKPVLASEAQKLRINHHYKRSIFVPLKNQRDGNNSSNGTGNADGSNTLRFDSSLGGVTQSIEAPTVEATGTTGPSQRRVRDGAQELAKQNVLQDELRMLRGFLSEESRDQKSKEAPSTMHADLLSRQAHDAHVLQIRKEKIAHGVDPSKHIALDMHALTRKDVGVHSEEVAQIAETHSLDDIVAGRVPLPLPPAERLLSNAQGVLKLALKQAPKFEPVRPPTDMAQAPPVRRSDVYRITSDLMKAQLQPLVAAGISAGKKHLSSVGTSMRHGHGVVDIQGPDADAPPRDLASLEKSFAKQIPSSNLLALESGEWTPPREIQTSPRLSSPSRRERKRLEMERVAGVELPGQEEEDAKRHQLLHQSQSQHSQSSKNVRTVRAAVAIYSVEDPSVDKLKEFNTSLPATFAREHEFTAANRAAGLEPRPREWIERPAARPSHALAPGRVKSKADNLPFALQKAWPLLSFSASAPLLLLPPGASSSVSASESGTGQQSPDGGADSNIFDLTSVQDAHDGMQEQLQREEDEEEQEPVEEEPSQLFQHADSSGVDESPIASDDDNTHAHDLVSNLIKQTTSSPSMLAHSESQTTLQTVQQHDIVVPSVRSQVVDGDVGEGSGRSASQDLIPFTLPPPAAAVAAPVPAPLIILPGGSAMRVLELEGLSAGPLDTGLPTIGSGYILPADARTIHATEFPLEGMPSREVLQKVAKELGHQSPNRGGGVNRPLLSLARLKEQSQSLARELHQSQHLSSPLAAKTSRLIPRPRQLKTPQQRNEFVAKLDAEVRDATVKQARSHTRPQTAAGRMHSSSTPLDQQQSDRSEIFDMDELVDSMGDQVRSAESPSTPPRVRPHSGVVHRSPPSGLRTSVSASSLHRGSTSASSQTQQSTAGLFVSASSSSLGGTQPSSPLADKRPRTKSAGKHGHPARIGPSFLSTSSADVPAMVWLAERVAARAQSGSNGDGSNGGNTSTQELLDQFQQPRDSQALVRPVSAPLAAFNPATLPKRQLPPPPVVEVKVKKQVPKTYFQPNSAKKVLRSRGNSRGSSPKAGVRTASDRVASPSSPKPTSPKLLSPILGTNRLSPKVLTTSNVPSVLRDLSPEKNGTAGPLAPPVAKAANANSTLLSLLNSIPPEQEAYWELSKNKNGSTTSHFTKRGSIQFNVMDAAFIQAVSVPLTPSEAEAATKELHERRMKAESEQATKELHHRRMASARLARQASEERMANQAAAEEAVLNQALAAAMTLTESKTEDLVHSRTPSQQSESDSSSAALLPRAQASQHRRGSSLAFEQVPGSIAVNKRPVHLRSMSGSWLGHLPPNTPANVTSSGSLVPLEESTEQPSPETIEEPSIPLLPERHPLDRPSSFLVPNKIRSLPVPPSAEQSVYTKAKINPYVNAPMHKF